VTTPSHSLPPGPPGYPLLGSVLPALKDPIALFTSTTQEYGDVASFRLLRYRYVLLNDPEAIRHVLATNAKAYVKSRNYAGLKVMLGEGLLTARESSGRSSAASRSPRSTGRSSPRSWTR
jgi:hypothetical protein